MIPSNLSRFIMSPDGCKKIIKSRITSFKKANKRNNRGLATNYKIHSKKNKDR